MKSKDQILLENYYLQIRENILSKIDKLNALKKLSQDKTYRVGTAIYTDFYYHKDSWTPFKYTKAVEYCPNITALDLIQAQEKLVEYVKNLPTPVGSRVRYMKEEWLKDFIDEGKDLTLYDRTVTYPEDGPGMSPGNGQIMRSTIYVAVGEESPYYTKDFINDKEFVEFVNRWLEPF
jgi:hypothetical protein